MKKLLSLVVLLIALVSNKKKLIEGYKAEIARLQGIIDKEDIDDEERDARLAELEELESAASRQSEEIATLLNEEPSVPSVDENTFETTAAPSASVSDLAFRESQSENAGQATAVPEVSAAPQAAPAPATEGSDKNTESQK